MALGSSAKAALWMVGAIASFTAMAVAGREMASELDTFEIMMYRSFIGILIVLSIARYTGTLSQITKQHFGLHFIRNISHFAGQNLWFYAVAVIPFAQLFAFEFSTPLWVAILAPIFLAEKLTKVRIMAALLGFVGILMVVRPGAISISPGIIAAALCAIGFSGAYIATKLLSRTESITSIMFWLTAMQLVFGIVCAAYDGDVAMPSRSALPLVILIGCTGLLAHYCITSALKVAPAIVVSPMDFFRLPVMILIGSVFYNESLDIWVVVGAVVIFMANFWNILGEGRQKIA